MSRDPLAADESVALNASQKTFESYPSRETQLGSLQIKRALPLKDRRLVGPWCFLDRFGPLIFGEGKPMDVAPHPHIGLQTVSWLLDGEIVHDDSLGYQAVLRPGGVNVMTSGAGIAHSEQTPPANSRRLDGVQLWVALPDEHRHGKPFLEHTERVPVVESSAGIVQVFAGGFAGAASPVKHFSEIVGADVQIHPGQAWNTELRPQYEHAALVLRGECSIDGRRLENGMLHYLGRHRTEIEFRSVHGGRLMFIGGLPFPEAVLMWWNFVARTHDEIAQARADWQERQGRFGEVRAYHGPRLEAPPLNLRARPNPVS